MTSIIGDELIHHMEQILLSEHSIRQAKIVDLADPNAPHQDLCVAFALNPMGNRSDDAIAVRSARKNLMQKVVHLGGRSVVPKKWAKRASLPVSDDRGQVDVEALRCDLLGVPRESATEASAETMEEKIFLAVASTLNIDREQLSLDSSFAKNGGDELLAIEVFQRLMQEGISLRVLDIQNATSLAELPTLVISHRGKTAQPAQTFPTSQLHEISFPEAAPKSQVHDIVIPDVSTLKTGIPNVIVPRGVLNYRSMFIR